MNIRGITGFAVVCVLALMAGPGIAQVAPTPAGPIWNNHDAQGKCPRVCAERHMAWRGDWRTVRPGDSECDCIGHEGRWSGHERAWSGRGGSGSSCTAPPVKQCRGCSISCQPGQNAHCQTGDVGIFKGHNDSICAHEAKCACQ